MAELHKHLIATLEDESKLRGRTSAWLASTRPASADQLFHWIREGFSPELFYMAARMDFC